MTTTKKLKFGKGNAKLDKTVYTFSIPAGHTCPGAKDCKSKALVGKDGKRYIQDGKHTEFRCFAASQEVLYGNTFKARRHNLELLKAAKTPAAMAKLIMDSLPKNARIVRVHVSGDFFNLSYMKAWFKVAEARKDVLFYAYTKSLNYWSKLLGDVPSNFVLTASRGGRHDGLIEEYELREARVVFSEEEAKRLGLPIDHDDSHAMKRGGNFALLLHGTQPAGSKAAKALKKLRMAGKGGYSK